MIQAIETVYNGYRFRSRLEARWAVFFDAAGIKYQYEPEGYKLSDGRMYLPDFYLPEADTHIEVKADTPSAIPDVERCASMILWGGPIKRIVFLSDIPGPCDGGLWHFPCLFCFDGNVAVGWYFFSDFTPCGHVSSASYPRPFSLCEDDKIWVNHYRPIEDSFSLRARSDQELRFGRIVDHGTARLNDKVAQQLAMNGNTFKAFIKARKARFEHGEKP